MGGKKCFHFIILSICALGLSVGDMARAGEYEIVYSLDGKPIFQFNYTAKDPDSTDQADWDIQKDRYAALRAALVYGAKQWAEVLGPGAVNTQPVPILVYGNDEQNAGAASSIMDAAPYLGYTEVAAMLIRNMDPGGEDVGVIEIGSWYPYYGSQDDSDPAFYYLGPITHQPLNGDQFHLASTMYHEIGHALGITSPVIHDSSAPPLSRFAQTLSIWDQRLRDNNGNAPRAGQLISDTNNIGVFFIAPGTTGTLPTFERENVRQVLGTAMPNGIPVNGWELGESGFDEAELSHIELRNSIMSHQMYRNYGVFMEAELAVLQDLGYVLDRKRYYGRSIYGDGGDIDNFDGFDSAATAGVGLHVYGSDNTITQHAGISSRGYGGLGIRVDGWENNLTIAPGVTVVAYGKLGRAVALAYGRNHTVNVRGTVAAYATDGRGLSFDFGSNAMGDYLGYRGSWILQEVDDDNRQYTNPEWKNSDRTESAFAEINGALADWVDISGTVVAKEAIYIAENAYVKEINILNGASITGDIVSEWRLDRTKLEKGFQLGNDGSYGENGEYGERGDLTTTLSFGKAMDANGVSLDSPDPAFRMRYDGDIDGAYSMATHIVGGELEYNGSASVFALVNDGVLSGNGTYELAFAPVYDPEDGGGVGLKGVFENNGVLAPGGDGIGSITVRLGSNSVERDFIYTNPNSGQEVIDNFIYRGDAPSFESTGVLSISFNPRGEHDTLEIIGTDENSQGDPVANIVTIGGTKSFQPVIGYYENGLSIQLADAKIIVTEDINTTTDYTDVTSISTLNYSSLTLRFDLYSNFGYGTHTITASRADDAYRSIAADPAGLAAGSELDRIASLGSPNADAQRVLAALDWIGDPGAAAAAARSLAPVRQAGFSRVLADSQHSFNRSLMNRFFGQGVLPGVRVSGVASEQGLASVPAGCHRASEEGTFFFLTPNGGGGRQSTRGWDVPGYSFWQAGMAMGVERRRREGVLGFHLAAGHVRLDGKGTADRFKSTGLYLGGHGSLSPVDWRGWHLFGAARVGVEIADQRREVVVGADRGLNKADWTGFAASALAGGGYDFDVGRVRFGPVVSLEYAMLHNPSFTESEGLGRLEYRRATYNSLRTNLGVRAGWEAGDRASVSLSAAWVHECLDRQGTTRAGFVGYGDSGMSIRARTAGRNSLAASAAVKFSLNERTTLSLEGGGEFFRKGYASGWGGVTWAREF